MRIHILGICGTFMAGIAILAREMNMQVSGCDQNCYPPMSTQLESPGIQLCEGYQPTDIPDDVDLVVIGNAMTRGNPVVEHVLATGIDYISGPQFLQRFVLNDRWVLAVSGTHGKTTTSSMLAWVLAQADMQPGFLIGGIPQNFGVSARLGETPFFVVEADEYDSAFFDKRSKFVHYRPRTLVINNLEFDHADIFRDIHDIERQFHHVIRTVPNNGLIIAPQGVESIDRVLAQGVWSDCQYVSDLSQSSHDKPLTTGVPPEWHVDVIQEDGSEFDVYFENTCVGRVRWSLIGLHNVANALNAIAAARHVGVTPDLAIEALSQFSPPKRRLEHLGEFGGVHIYDDFAHHPTAIQLTLEAMSARVNAQASPSRVIAVIEMRSNTMRSGYHRDEFESSVAAADEVLFFCAVEPDWITDAYKASLPQQLVWHNNFEHLLTDIVEKSTIGDHIVVMSNGGFNGIHTCLMDRLAK